MAKKRFQMTVMILLNEKPTSKFYVVNECLKGRILTVVKRKNKWIITVIFKADSMIELMVACDAQTISTEMH